MSTTSLHAIPDRLQVTLTLAHLLQKLDAANGPVGADQYRSVVERLSQELELQPADAGLHAILAAHPAAAELYENLNYQHAGLCRSPLERSLAAEMKAREVIAAARRPSASRQSDKSPG
jgi:hypothetical protein